MHIFLFFPSPSPLGKPPSGHYSCSQHPHKKQYSANPGIQREKRGWEWGGVELVGSASTRPALFSVLHYKDNVHNTILIYAQWTLVSKCEFFHPLLRNLFTAVYFLDFSKEKEKNKVAGLSDNSSASFTAKVCEKGTSAAAECSLFKSLKASSTRGSPRAMTQI